MFCIQLLLSLDLFHRTHHCALKPVIILFRVEIVRVLLYQLSAYADRAFHGVPLSVQSFEVAFEFGGQRPVSAQYVFDLRYAELEVTHDQDLLDRLDVFLRIVSVAVLVLRRCEEPPPDIKADGLLIYSQKIFYFRSSHSPVTCFKIKLCTCYTVDNIWYGLSPPQQ